MNKIDFFKHAIQNGWTDHISWIFSVFSIPVNKASDKPLSFGGNIVAEPWGYSISGIADQPIKLEDAKPGEPIYKFSDPITIDESWFPNVKGKIETTYGNVLVNAVVIVPSFGKNIPFITGRFTPKQIESKYIAPRLKSNVDPSQEKEDEIYVKNYTTFCRRVAFLEALTTLSCFSATPKSITPPPGITKFKKQLLEENKGNLHRPEVLSKIQDELQKYDDAYLAGDPAEQFISGKIKQQRKKMYQMVGAGLSFRPTGDIKPIVRSLDEGWDKDPDQFAAMLNDQRFGSFARGAETINGGVAGKYIIRVLSGYSVKDGDCGTKLGSTETLRDGDQDRYKGRYIIEGGKPKLLATAEDVGAYIGKSIVMRTPRMCKSGETTFCRICAGETLFRFRDSLVIPGTEISNTILYANMKQMHSSGLKTKEIDLQDAFF